MVYKNCKTERNSYCYNSIFTLKDLNVLNHQSLGTDSLLQHQLIKGVKVLTVRRESTVIKFSFVCSLLQFLRS